MEKQHFKPYPPNHFIYKWPLTSNQSCFSPSHCYNWRWVQRQLSQEARLQSNAGCLWVMDTHIWTVRTAGSAIIHHSCPPCSLLLCSCKSSSSPTASLNSCLWIASGLCFTVTKTEPSILYTQWKRYTELTPCQDEKAFFTWRRLEVDLHMYSLLWPLQRIFITLFSFHCKLHPDISPLVFFSLYTTCGASFTITQYYLFQRKISVY